jgi:hypothetical protein
MKSVKLCDGKMVENKGKLIKTMKGLQERKQLIEWDNGEIRK